MYATRWFRPRPWTIANVNGTHMTDRELGGVIRYIASQQVLDLSDRTSSTDCLYMDIPYEFLTVRGNGFALRCTAWTTVSRISPTV